MIADWNTDRLFVSDRLEPTQPALFADLRSALCGVAVEIIAGTGDIWCRDFMPVQLGESDYCQFVYDPDYLRGFHDLVTPPAACQLPFMRSYRHEPIVLDGGNIVASRSRVIMTEKVFTENPSIERLHLRQRLATIFQAECIFIPKDPSDPIGHADGVVRFVSEQRVFMNDYALIDPDYGTKVRTRLERSGLQVDMLPLFLEEGPDRRGEIPSAVGLYVNYLRVGNIVILPGYDRPEDQLAVAQMRRALPDATITQLPCRRLAEKGGVLNCVSWTIKSAARAHS